MSTSSSSHRFLYKILTSRPVLPVSRTLTPIDASDGFIHLSSASQTPQTAARFFTSQASIWLVKIDLRKLEAGSGEVKWEDSKSHGTFAHLYGTDIQEETVVEVTEQTRQDGASWEEALTGLED